MTVSDASTFLTKILDHKRTEVERQALKVPLAQLQTSIATAPRPRAFDAALRRPGRVALIAEVKKASPSKGVLVENFDPLALARTYAENGAAAISVLTEGRRFKGTLDDLIRVRLAVSVPVLRKDFIITAYQLFEARAAGADLVLLIVAALSDYELVCLIERAESIGLSGDHHITDERESACCAGSV